MPRLLVLHLVLCAAALFVVPLAVFSGHWVGAGLALLLLFVSSLAASRGS